MADAAPVEEQLPLCEKCRERLAGACNNASQQLERTGSLFGAFCLKASTLDRGASEGRDRRPISSGFAFLLRVTDMALSCLPKAAYSVFTAKSSSVNPMRSLTSSMICWLRVFTNVVNRR
jgi:hypothetical protein